MKNPEFALALRLKGCRLARKEEEREEQHRTTRRRSIEEKEREREVCAENASPVLVFLKPIDPLDFRVQMDDNMKQIQQSLIEIEIEGEKILLARHQLVENDKLRNGNREALTALRKKARTTKSSVPSPFDSIMKEIEGLESKVLVKEVCSTCGNHDPEEKTWMMFPGADVFVRVPFHAAHTIIEKDQAQLDYDSKRLQSFVKEKSLLISEKGILADSISPGVLRSLVTLTDKPK